MLIGYIKKKYIKNKKKEIVLFNNRKDNKQNMKSDLFYCNVPIYLQY